MKIEFTKEQIIKWDKYLPDIVHYGMLQYFGMRASTVAFPVLVMVSKHWSIDPIKFDDKLHAELGYSEKEHGSIYSFVENQISEEALWFLKAINKTT